MDELLKALRTRLGADQVRTQPEAMASYLQERRQRFFGSAAAIVTPADTTEVAATINLCAAHRAGVVPQGGNTGTVGGGVPGPAGVQVVLSLERLTRIREIDASGYTLTAEAGCTLAAVQRAAAGADRLFPLSYAAEEQCRIGGNLATNAGGMTVLRYGNARELTLGLEVVLANGEVWNGLRRLVKDNSTYDLRGLFIGSEGSLGVITAAVLRLFPRARSGVTALAGVVTPERALRLLAALRDACGETLTTCELMARTPLAFAVEAGCGEPLAAQHPWYVLAEATSSRDEPALTTAVAAALGEAEVTDYRLASEPEARTALWPWRRQIPEAQARGGASIKHDVSVPVASVPTFLAQADAAVSATLPSVRPCAFGHLGDGNIHYNLTRPAAMDDATFLAQWDTLARIVHDIAAGLDGSAAAEHGVGQMKPAEIARLRSPLENTLMHQLKAALDPKNILNPGKALPVAHAYY